ncbi:MAG TPA: RodZ domain-containing protein [Actinomycetota bacterium]|nr:RodZ domain-containing protein [Actinomycetota bacterium]
MALRAAKGSIGERLRQARTDRGIDLDRAARETRIDRRDLEALEADARLPEPHDGIYARIFLREYARYLGLKPGPLVEAYRATHPAPDRPLIGGPGPVERSPSRFVAPVLVVISVAVVIGLAVMGMLRRSPEVPVPREPMGPAPASPSAPTVAGESTPSPGAQEPDRLIVRVVEGESWIRVSREGEILLEGTQPTGFSRGFRIGDGLDIVVGNAGAVRPSAGGRSLGSIGEPGGVFAGSVVVEDGRAELVG